MYRPGTFTVACDPVIEPCGSSGAAAATPEGPAGEGGCVIRGCSRKRPCAFGAFAARWRAPRQIDTEPANVEVLMERAFDWDLGRRFDVVRGIEITGMPGSDISFGGRDIRYGMPRHRGPTPPPVEAIEYPEAEEDEPTADDRSAEEDRTRISLRPNQPGCPNRR